MDEFCDGEVCICEGAKFKLSPEWGIVIQEGIRSEVIKLTFDWMRIIVALMRKYSEFEGWSPDVEIPV
jgi:hypothetical protein